LTVETAILFPARLKGFSMTKALLAIALLIATGAQAAEPNKQDTKQNRLVCREIGETGSRLDTKRVCMTKEQWEQSRRDAREAVDQIQTTHQTNPNGG
jgi:hypothetical protein